MVPRKISEGDIMLKTEVSLLRGLALPNKFTPKWEGPYMVKHVYDSGYCKLAQESSYEDFSPINMKWVKHYYS